MGKALKMYIMVNVEKRNFQMVKYYEKETITGIDKNNIDNNF